MLRYSVAMSIMILMVAEVCSGAVFYDVAELDIDYKYDDLPSIKLNSSGEAVSRSYVFEKYLMLGENDSGQDVGMVCTEDGLHRAIFRQNGVVYTIKTPEGADSVAFDINNPGDIVGEFYIPGDLHSHAFLRSKDGSVKFMEDFGGDGSSVFAINNLGQAVGLAVLNAKPSHAFFYENGQMKDLNDLIPPSSGWELVEAQDIDDEGRIVGFGFLNGRHCAFLLKPLDEIPEGARRIPFVSRSYVFEKYLMLGENDSRPWDTGSYDFGFLSGENEDLGPWDTGSCDFGFLSLADSYSVGKGLGEL